MRIIHILGWSDIVLVAIFNWWAKNSKLVNVNGFYIKGQELKKQSCLLKGGSEKCKTSPKATTQTKKQYFLVTPSL